MRKRILLSILMFFSMILVACSLDSNDDLTKLDTPIVTLSDDVASWNPILNAIRYEICVNDESSYLDADITSKKLEDNDTFKVRAISDEINYLHSDWSNIVTYKKSPSVKDTFKVTFEINDHGNLQYPLVDVKKLPNPLPVLSEDGWIFNGWFMDQNYKQKALPGATLVSDVILYASWTFDKEDLVYTSLSEIKAYEKYKVHTQVYAVNEESFIIGDGSIFYLVRRDINWNKDLVVGDIIELTGVTTIYANAIEFAKTSTYKKLGHDEKVSPTPYVHNDIFANIYMNLTLANIRYTELSGKLMYEEFSELQSSNYVIETTAGYKYMLTDPIDEDILEELLDSQVTITGYLTGYEQFYTNTFQFSLTKINGISTELTVGKQIQNEYDKLKAGITDIHSTWEFSGVVLDMSATTYTSYNNYSVKLILDVDGVLIGIYNGQTDEGYPTNINGLEVGKKVSVKGVIAENYSLTSGQYTAYIEFSKPLISWEGMDEDIIDPTVNQTVNFVMINDTHGAFTDLTDGYSIGRVDSLIDELEANNGDYIKIANGDIFQGSYVSSSLYGRPLVDALNKMDFDAFVLGNHEFDWGLDKIALYKDGNLENGELNFPFLGANIFYKGTNTRPEFIDAYTVIEYNGIQVGIIGVMGEDHESSILKKYIDDYEFVDPKEIIKTNAEYLRSALGCEVVVVAIHDYYDGFDLADDIASFTNDAKIDSIFCAHSHSYINDTVRRSDGVIIPVVQNNDKNKKAVSVSINLDSNNQMIDANVKFYNPGNYAISSDIQEIYTLYQDVILEADLVLGETSYNISKSELGKYAVNAMIEYDYDNPTYQGIDVAIINTGGVRATIGSGSITKADVFEVFPFNNVVILVNINGKDLKSLCSRNSNYLYIGTTSIYSNYNNLDDNTIYQLAIIDYVFSSKDSYYQELNNAECYFETEIIMRDILMEYIDSLY